ncbi:MAG: type I methionyl aminopeptidase [Bacilli bacterium]|nr:type I methionyl aminopeptidase [Bacilli bacterium]
MVSIKSDREIELMKYAGHINYLCHKYLESKLRPGITTGELDKLAGEFITSHGCISSSLGYEGYPGNICISVNDEVVHGIGGKRKIKNGDIVSLDICMSYKGYHSDSAATYPVGTITKEKEELIKNTKDALMEGLKMVKEGAKLGDISNAIETYAHRHHLGVVEELCGHGIGTELHEDPDIPNFGEKGTGLTLKAGMTFAIEPMLNLGTKHVYMLDDDWTIVTADGKPSAHFEHTVLVTKTGYKILTGE